MHYCVFTVPVADPEAIEDLNRFLSGRRVLSVQREFVANGASSFWTFCVEYLQSGRPHASGSSSPGRKPRIDYKEVLSPEHFTVFSRLRECRKQLAAAEGIPAFGVCTNEQLAEMARAEELTSAIFQTVDGFGEAKAKKYGPALIEAFAQKGPPK